MYGYVTERGLGFKMKSESMKEIEKVWNSKLT